MRDLSGEPVPFESECFTCIYISSSLQSRNVLVKTRLPCRGGEADPLSCSVQSAPAPSLAELDDVRTFFLNGSGTESLPTRRKASAVHLPPPERITQILRNLGVLREAS